MTDSVRHALEGMVPELQDAVRKQIFTSDEIKSIVKKRTQFEHKLKARGKHVQDYFRYIEYEYKLDTIRRQRVGKLGRDYKPSLCDWAITKHIHHLFNRAVAKYPGQLNVWLSYIDIAKKLKSYHRLPSIYARALQLHVRNIHLWLSAARWEFEVQANPVTARKLLQRAVHVNGTESIQVWIEWFRMECAYVCKIRQRIQGDNDKNNTRNGNNDDIEMYTDTDQDNDDLALDDLNLPPLDDKYSHSSTCKDILDTDPLLQYAVAKLVYQEAITIHKTDITLRQECLTIATTVPKGEELIQLIHESIVTDLACKSASALALSCTWRILAPYSTMTYDDPNYAIAVDESINLLDKVINQSEYESVATELRDEILKVIRTVIKQVGGPASPLGPYLIEQLRQHIIAYIKESLDESISSKVNMAMKIQVPPGPGPLLVSTWKHILSLLSYYKQLLLGINEKDIIRIASDRYPKDVKLVIERVRIEPQYAVTAIEIFNNQGKELIEIYMAIMDIVHQHPCYHTILNPWIPQSANQVIKLWKTVTTASKNLSGEEMIGLETKKCELMKKWIKSMAIHGGNSKVKEEEEDKLIQWMLTWAPIDEEHSQWIEIMNNRGYINTQRLVMERVVCKMSNQCKGWIDYIELEAVKAKDNERALQVYSRAIQMMNQHGQETLAIMEAWKRMEQQRHDKKRQVGRGRVEEEGWKKKKKKTSQ